MSSMKSPDDEPEFMTRLKPRFPVMGILQTLLAQTRMRLCELVDGELSLDARRRTLRIWSRKIGKTRTVPITPDLVEPLASFLEETPANRKARVTRALRAFGRSYRRSLFRLRYQEVREPREERP